MKILSLFIFITILHLALTQNDCFPTKCSPSGPIIRFPFRLKDHQPAHCGFPGFELYCTQNNITKLVFQFPVTTSTNGIKIPLQTTVSVWDIDYKAQKMLASNAKSKSCLPETNIHITTLNSSNSLKFEVEPLGYSDGYTLSNCSDTRGYNYDGDERIACLSRHGYKVIAFASLYDVTSLPPHSSCFKMYNISYVPDIYMFSEREGDEYGTRFYLRWGEPSCGGLCEGKGNSCRLKNGGGGGGEERECFGYEKPQHDNTCASIPLTTGLITAGTIILLLITIASYFILRSIKRKKSDRKTIEKIVEIHKGNIKSRRYLYADIKKITCIFNNAMNETLHKGTLVDKTCVIVKTTDSSEQNIVNFINGVETIGRMQHANVLKLIGYCIDRRRRALIYESLQSQTLENFMTLDDRSLYRVALGVAKGINYVRQECAERILNLDNNISPRDILLDDNFDPKILVFPTVAGNRSSASSYVDVLGKADIFCFGMLLLGILGRRRNNLIHGREKENSGVYFPEWIYSEMNREEGNEVVKRLLIVGSWCIQWFPSDRPSMKCVVEMIEGDDMPIMPPNPFASLLHKNEV